MYFNCLREYPIAPGYLCPQFRPHAPTYSTERHKKGDPTRPSAKSLVRLDGFEALPVARLFLIALESYLKEMIIADHERIRRVVPVLAFTYAFDPCN